MHPHPDAGWGNLDFSGCIRMRMRMPDAFLTLDVPLYNHKHKTKWYFKFIRISIVDLSKALKRQTKLQGVIALEGKNSPNLMFVLFTH